MRLQTSPKELRGQLIIFVAVLWTIGVVNITKMSERLHAGKGNDFLHFYALADTGLRNPTQFANSAHVGAAQVQAVPESKEQIYPPVYGPQVALALAPLARLPYERALALWMVLTAVMYFGAVAVALRSAVAVRPHATALLAALGFPPFWYLLQYGQLSVVALCIIVAASVALRRGNSLSAAALLGLLIYKPPLFAPVFAIIVLSGSWRMAGVMLAAAVAEILLTVPWVGIGGLVDYLNLTLRLPRMAADMSAKPAQMHSLRAFWILILGKTTPATILYAATAAAALAAAAQVWRRVAEPSLRMSALVLGTALAAPHLYVYDLVIVAPVWIWLTDWYLTERLPRTVGRVLYVGYLAGLCGILAHVFLPVQVSVVCSAYLTAQLWRWSRQVTVRESSGSPEPVAQHGLVSSLQPAPGLSIANR